jgi:16S rRNA (cytosine967-C5)-methyltransferase
LYTHELFKAGHFEIQDEAAQLVTLLTGEKPGSWVVDFCAGGGGKTLALAALMKNKGRLEALDINEYRLEEIKPRLQRAGVHNCRATLLKSENDAWVQRHAGQIDTVLVDAPCSGSGTWRRNPDAKWRLTPTRLQELTEIQASVLTSAAHLVKPGGRLVYATCSLLKRENDDQVANFLAYHPDFSLLPVEEAWTDSPFKGDRLHLSPAKEGCDGFFAAVFHRRKLAV